MSMIFANFTPWQLLLWAASLLMIITPLMIILVTGCVSGYYSAKERHKKAMINYAVKAVNAAVDAAPKTIEKKVKEKSEEKTE